MPDEQRRALLLELVEVLLMRYSSGSKKIVAGIWAFLQNVQTGNIPIYSDKYSSGVKYLKKYYPSLYAKAAMFILTPTDLEVFNEQQ